MLASGHFASRLHGVPEEAARVRGSKIAFFGSLTTAPLPRSTGIGSSSIPSVILTFFHAFLLTFFLAGPWATRGR